MTYAPGQYQVMRRREYDWYSAMRDFGLSRPAMEGRRLGLKTMMWRTVAWHVAHEPPDEF